MKCINLLVDIETYLDFFHKMPSLLTIFLSGREEVMNQCLQQTLAIINVFICFNLVGGNGY
jgi:hypothetical protein